MHMRIRSMLMGAILVIQNDDTMAMLLYEASLVGVQLFSYVNTFFCSNKFTRLLDTCVHTLYNDASQQALLCDQFYKF